MGYQQNVWGIFVDLPSYRPRGWRVFALAATRTNAQVIAHNVRCDLRRRHKGGKVKIRNLGSHVYNIKAIRVPMIKGMTDAGKRLSDRPCGG
jgi:hypothetical protein